MMEKVVEFIAYETFSQGYHFRKLWFIFAFSLSPAGLPQRQVDKSVFSISLFQNILPRKFSFLAVIKKG